MNSTEIYKAVYQWFLNYEYKLFNSYVYDWECDFFAMSKSRYAVEVEVKVSRSDFFKDFEKPKHLLFQSHIAKQSHHIYREFNRYVWDRDRLICSYIEPKITWDIDKGIRRNRYTDYIVNDWGGFHVRKNKVEVMAPCTSIRIQPINEILCPNSIYYAAPAGLIKPNEIPKYAGLLEVTNESVVNCIKAPYIHKQKQNYTPVLLSKFYNLWQHKSTREEKFSIMLNDKAV